MYNVLRVRKWQYSPYVITTTHKLGHNQVSFQRGRHLCSRVLTPSNVNAAGVRPSPPEGTVSPAPRLGPAPLWDFQVERGLLAHIMIFISNSILENYRNRESRLLNNTAAVQRGPARIGEWRGCRSFWGDFLDALPHGHPHNTNNHMSLLLLSRSSTVRLLELPSQPMMGGLVSLSHRPENIIYLLSSVAGWALSA